MAPSSIAYSGCNRAFTSSIPASSSGGDDGDRGRARQLGRGREIEPLQDAIAVDVGMDDGGDAGILVAARQLQCRERAGLGPALHGHFPVACVDAHGDAAGKVPAGLTYQARIAQGRGSQDHPPHTVGEPALDGGGVADAAAKLDGHVDGLQDRPNRRGIRRLPRERSVQVHHVEIAEALLLEYPGLGSGIVVEDSRRGHLTAGEAHAPAVLEVDCGEQDHGETTG